MNANVAVVAGGKIVVDWSAGQEIDGTSMSTMVTVNEHEFWLSTEHCSKMGEIEH